MSYHHFKERTDRCQLPCKGCNHHFLPGEVWYYDLFDAHAYCQLCCPISNLNIRTALDGILERIENMT
jgi:hypothetical protein